MTVFAEGATVVRRDVVRGRVWSAAPHRVVSDTGTELTLARWPGIESRAPAAWIEWMRTRHGAARERILTDLAGGRWHVGPWVWRDALTLTWVGLDPDFSVHHFSAADGTPQCWYVNFERPVRRTGIGIDTCDLLLDLVAAPDLRTWTWKDEDEYAQGRRLGLIDDAEHRRVQRARERAVAFVEAGDGPLGRNWSGWRPDPAWPMPALPPTALDAVRQPHPSAGPDTRRSPAG